MIYLAIQLGKYIVQYCIFIPDKQWKSSIVSSHQFDNPSGHQNPSSMPVSPYVKEADPVNVGAFKISKGWY